MPARTAGGCGAGGAAIAWLVVTFVLLVWNAAYCALTILADARGPAPARAVWGMFALAGVLSAAVMLLVAVGVAGSGI